MKIVHLCLGCFYPDNYSYQENMLPKFHKIQGHEVEVIASLVTFDLNGNYAYMDEAKSYFNEYNILVTRLNYCKPIKIYKKLKRYVGVSDALEKAKPDILFIHGCQFMDMDKVVKYIRKHDNIKIYVDNHADFSNSATNWFSKNILHKFLWCKSAQMIEPYTIKFYGVLPARVDFLKNIYKVPEEKCELLVMGADDDKVNAANATDVRYNLRKKYGINDNDFLIITGGKIDAWKTQTLLLMEAVKNINKDNVKLLIFGSVSEELQSKVEALADNVKVQYIGWIKAEDSYDYFAASDLVVFPGRHSVFWEQVVAQGIPMMCKHWDGTTHIDIGGNVMFLYEDSVEEIQKVIEDMLINKSVYRVLKESAQSNRKNEFLYGTISAKSIDLK